MDDQDEADVDISTQVMAHNRKQKKSGGFQSMGLDHNVFRGITKRGYKIPTPIQRKTIPMIFNGTDVVAMARTGSGKTAAFLIPMFQKLKCRSSQAGARAILMSPTRELALQTYKFTQDLNKFVGLKLAILVGGDNMEEQFAAIHENPDVIIATPGRLLHVAVEMNLKLKSVEYIVFDEADRLFEMGFEEQLKDIIRRLPDNRQTLLFSATLPKTLVDFARVGLNQPVLVRLDVDSKISDKLNLAFLMCRFEDKLAVLFHLLNQVIDTSKEQTIIFCATKHHVEYLKEVLTKNAIRCSYVYSSLDATARKVNVEKFRKFRTSVLLVTDLAARGIDIPLLDNVINFHFPAKPKIFVHRVGRVARAGRSGRAISIVSSEEMPYVLDLYLFLGRSLQLVKPEDKLKDVTISDLIGVVPRSDIDEQDEIVRSIVDGNSDLEFLRQGSVNAYKQYVKTRPIPSRDSVERVKREKMTEDLGNHPIFGSEAFNELLTEKRESILDQLKQYKPQATVFEHNVNSKSSSWVAMKDKRRVHSKFVVTKPARTSSETASESAVPTLRSVLNSQSESHAYSEADIQNVFSKIIQNKFNQNVDSDSIMLKKKRNKSKIASSSQENEYFMPYEPKDFHSEAGLSVEKNTFEQEVSSAVVDFTADDGKDLHRQKSKLKWDRKRKKFVNDNEDSKAKKIKTESGVWIPATYKTDLYNKWKNKNKVDHTNDDDEDNDDMQKKKTFGMRNGKKRKETSQVNVKGKRKGNHEFKSKEQILKDRKRKEKMKAYQNYKHEKTSKKKLSQQRRRK